MSDTKKEMLDDARHGGGIGDIGRQPVDPSSENTGEGDPVIEANERGDAVALTVDEDAVESEEDLDAAADETEAHPT